MTNVKLRCFHHPCTAESQPFLMPRVVLVLWPLLLAISISHIFWPKYFRRLWKYHYMWSGWLIEPDAIPRERVFYGLCPKHSAEFLKATKIGSNNELIN